MSSRIDRHQIWTCSALIWSFFRPPDLGQNGEWTISVFGATPHLVGGYSALHAEEKEDFKAILLISSFFDSEIPDALNEGRQSCLHIGLPPLFLASRSFFFSPSRKFFQRGSRKVCKKHQNDEDLLPSLTHWRPYSALGDDLKE